MSNYEFITGRIKWYSIHKGFGFIIRDDDASEIFLHHSAIVYMGNDVCKHTLGICHRVYRLLLDPARSRTSHVDPAILESAIVGRHVKFWVASSGHGLEMQREANLPGQVATHCEGKWPASRTHHSREARRLVKSFAAIGVRRSTAFQAGTGTVAQHARPRVM